MDADLKLRRQQIERARSRFVVDEPAGGDAPVDRASDDGTCLDPGVARSWSRCAPTVTSAQDSAPVDTEDLEESWHHSPIRRAVPDLVTQLEAVARDGDFVAAVTDPEGRILWSWGGASMRRQAESVNFVAGGRWDEESAGTNALGLALIHREPSVVFSMEHWCSAVHDWVCYSAPVLGPDDRPLGVIDLSTSWQRATPLALTTVSALARLVQLQLPAATDREGGTDRGTRRAAAVGGPVPVTGATTPGRVDPPTLQLTLLGRGSATLDGTPLLLTRRQLEILAVLSAEDGIGLDELQANVYGDHRVSQATVRAEVSHLRSVLGGSIAPRRYRLTLPVEVDLVGLERCIRRGDLTGALAHYRGQLLVGSEAPWVVERRHRSDVSLRNALLGAGTTAELLGYAEVHPFDLEVLAVAADRVGPSDPLGPIVRARMTIALEDD